MSNVKYCIRNLVEIAIFHQMKGAASDEVMISERPISSSIVVATVPMEMIRDVFQGRPFPKDGFEKQ
jgi:hypothetical protein